MTPEQERYLIEFANAGLAEAADIEQRNKQILQDQAVAEARSTKEDELKAQAEALVADGLREFDENVRPTIKPS